MIGEIIAHVFELIDFSQQQVVYRLLHFVFTFFPLPRYINSLISISCWMNLQRFLQLNLKIISFFCIYY